MTANNESPKRDFKAGQIYSRGGMNEERLSYTFLYLVTEVADNVVFYRHGSYELSGFKAILSEEAVAIEKAQWCFGILITDEHKARFDKELIAINSITNIADIGKELAAISFEIVPTDLQVQSLQTIINELKSQKNEDF